MAVTRLKRKGRRNKTVSRVRVETIDRLNAQPVIKNVDVEAIKKSFGGKSKTSASKAPAAASQEEE